HAGAALQEDARAARLAVDVRGAVVQAPPRAHAAGLDVQLERRAEVRDVEAAGLDVGPDRAVHAPDAELAGGRVHVQRQLGVDPDAQRWDVAPAEPGVAPTHPHMPLVPALGPVELEPGKRIVVVLALYDQGVPLAAGHVGPVGYGLADRRVADHVGHADG